jgi:DNA topoisomerase-1
MPSMDEDDIPLAARLKAKNVSKRQVTQFENSDIVSSESLSKKLKDTDDDLPLIAKLSKLKTKSSTSSLKVIRITDNDSQKQLTEKEKKPSKKSTSIQAETALLEESEAEEHRWWEDPSFLEEGNEIKWTTLQHNGVLFPPEYIPHGIPLVYAGEEIVLPPEAEEIAGFFAALLETEHAKNEIFAKNFFEDFRSLLVEKFPLLAQKITSFHLCDFTKMHYYFEQLKEAKKSISKEDKEKIKRDKAQLEEKYMFCLLDGRKERVGNFRVEPPGLFRGRGKHPKTGKLKARVQPEQITINIGEGVQVPKPPEGHSWGKVIHNNQVAWLACWNENINGQYKYVLFAANSSLKGQSDYKKFEKARELKLHIQKIRIQMKKELVDKSPVIRQRATALWLIDKLALRAGNEKGDEEADTVGCCSLRVEHIQLEEPNFVVFDFLGKDSIRYYNRVAVDEQVFSNLKLFTDQKDGQSMLFDSLSAPTLNSYLDTLMPGLTAKVFRTFNASFTFQQQLDLTPENLENIHEKILSYNRSNREVAILCNHQRAVPKTHHVSIAKLKEKISIVKLQRHRVKRELKEILKLKELQEHAHILHEESDFEEDEVIELEHRLELEKEEKARKKKELNLSQQQQQQASGTEESSSCGSNLATSETSHVKNSHSFGNLSREKLFSALERFNGKLAALKMQIIDRDENKTTALGTSKTNYLDPRISAAWCKKHSVPIERIFPKTLREKFRWALAVDADWKF